MSSYVEKYATNFFDNDNNKFRLQIFQYGYSGSVSNNITLAKSPVVINYSQDDDYFQPIIGSTCKLRFYVEESTGGSQWEDEDTNWNTANFFWERSEFEFLTPTYDREFKIRVHREALNGTSDAYAVANRLKDTSVDFTASLKVGDLVINTSTRSSTTVAQVSSATIIKLSSDIFADSGGETYEIFRNIWTGFIMQDSYTLPITSPPFVVEVYASDLIGTINGYNIDLTTERPEAFDVIQNCLKNINIQNASGTSGKSLDFSYKVLCRLNQFSTLTSSGSSNSNPFEQVFIRSVDGLEDENGNYLNAKEVLISLLRMYNCRIFQHEGAWTIIDNASLALTSFSDGGGSYSKEFKTYDKSGTAIGTEAISSPVVTLNSSTSASTLQPVNNDFVKIIKRPAIRQRTQIRIKDTLKSQFSNGGFELGATRVPTFNFGFYLENWTIGDDLKAFGVESNTADTSSGPQPIIYGITPYAGSRSAITIGSTSSNTVILTSTTANIGSTVEPLTLSFANYADDPDNPGNLSYQYKFRIKVTPTSGGVKYYDLDNQQWVSSASDGINSLSGSVQEQWNLNEFEIQPSPITGSVTLEIFLSKEDIYNNPNFRMYFDDFFLKGISDLEYFDTRTLIINASFKDNSGVLPAFENRYGMLNDTKYSNCLVDSGGNPITGYKNFDGSISDSATLETLMNRQRLNEFANSNDRYEGTFKKFADSNGFLTPLNMLSFPKILFDTFTVDNHLAIDNYEFDVAENRYKLSTHTPTQSNLTVAGDISSITSFYKIKPED